MVNINQLYENVKSLVHQKFEYKEEEDTTLPEIVESYFNYNQGELEISMPYMKLEVTGSSFSTYSSTPFTYNGLIFVDWGDNILVEYTGGKLSHSFTDGLNSHTVKVYGDLTSLGDLCFYNHTGLTSINIPPSVTSIGGACFYNCTSLTSITLNWDTASTIFTYDQWWINNTPSTLKFRIPTNTTSLYIAKSYPSDKLVESD